MENIEKTIDKGKRKSYNHSVKHEGNFFFSGKLNGHKVQICTEPADDDQESVNIYSIEIGD